MDPRPSKIIPLPISEKQLSHWDSEEIFYSGDAFFPGLLKEISEAKRSIVFETYIFQQDELGLKVLDALKEAARRGVEVKLLVDGVGSPDWNRALLTELQAAGVQARIYHPYPWVRWGYRFLSRLFSLRRLFRWFQILNRRDHRKLCVIDEKAAFLGSMNVAVCHLYSVKGEEAWRDTGLRVEGGEVPVLLAAFERAWGVAWSPFRERRPWLRRERRRRWRRLPAPQLLRLNYSHFLRRQYYQGLLRRVWSARNIIWITSAYFIPERSLIRALQAAAWGGVDVRILMTRKSDVRLVRWVGSLILHWLLRSGVRIFEYLPSVLHAKTLLIDDWAIVGSCNLNYRSFHLDLEVDGIVEEEHSIESLKKQFLRDLTFSEELTLKRWEREFWLERFLGRIVFFLRYWM